MKNHSVWTQCLKKLYDTNEKDLADSIVEFLEKDLTQTRKIHRMKSLKPNKKLTNKGVITNSSFFSGVPNSPKQKSLIASKNKNITSFNVSGPRASLNNDTNLTIHNPLVGGITEQNYLQIRREIDQLSSGQIDQLIQTKNHEEVMLNTKTVFDRQVKTKDSVFKSLRRKLDEPLHLNSPNTRRVRNHSIRNQPGTELYFNLCIGTIKNNIKKKLFGRDHESPFPSKKSKKTSITKVHNRLKQVERIELDRPILIKGKMDVLWTKPTELLPEINIVRYQIEVKFKLINMLYRKRNQSE
jgi:hypothetical protein